MTDKESQAVFSILAIGYELLSSFIPFLIVLYLFRRVRGKYSASFSIWHYILPIAFALYIIAVFHVTGVGTLYDAMTAEFEEMKERINLVPFSNKINVIGYLLNIVMFVPLGFLVPMIWNRMKNAPYVILTGASISLLIESSQLLSYRGTDVDDLILNTFGAAIGFLIYKVWDRFSESKYQLVGIDSRELTAYILVLFLGRFFLFNYIGFIELVYGL